MDEATLHDLSEKMGGRFKLTTLVQKRLIELMRQRSPVITESSGGRPIRAVVDEVAGGRLRLAAPDGQIVADPAGEAEAEE